MNLRADNFREMTGEQLLNIFDMMYNSFCMHEAQDRTPDSVSRWAYRVMEAGPHTTLRDLDKQVEVISQAMDALLAALSEKRLLTASAHDPHNLAERFTRMNQIWRFAYTAIKSQLFMYDAAMSYNTAVFSRSDFQSMMFVPEITSPLTETLNAQQQLIMGIMHEIRLQGLRRIKDDDSYYVQIKTPGGVPSHAYESAGSMIDIVYSICNRERSLTMWRMLTGGSNVSSMAKNLAVHLRECLDSTFPFIDRDRSWCNHSFRNGVLICDTSVFEPDWDITRPSEVTANTMVFLKYGSPALTSDIVCIKYHDEDMPEAYFDPRNPCFEDPSLIDTHVHDSLLIDQKIPADAIDWFQALGFGRSILPLGRFDNWHCGIIIIGAPGTGKTTIADDIAAQLPMRFVNSLNMEVQEKYCLSNLYQGMLWTCHELRERGWTMPQDLFLQLLEGHANVSVGRKYMNDYQVRKWMLPFLGVGNAIPTEWVEAVLRRIIVWRFDHVPPHTNPYINEELRKERPAMMVKGLRKYFQLVKTHRRSDLRKHMPAYCKEVMEGIEGTILPLVRMLKDTSIFVRDARCAMTLREMMSEFKKWRLDHDLNSARFPNREDASRILRGQGLRLEEYKNGQCVEIGGRYLTGHVVHGIQLAQFGMQASPGADDVRDSSARGGGGPGSGGAGAGAGGGDDRLGHADFDVELGF